MQPGNGVKPAANAPATAALLWAEIGHDLRQPLYAAKLLTEALGTEKDSSKRKAIVGDLSAVLMSLERLLDQTIDFGKLESGSVKPEIRGFAVSEVIGEVARQGGVLARAKGLDLRLVNSSCAVRSDPMLLHRVVSNLVGNAVRYSETGRVLLGCRRRGRELAIEIWDTGIGIPESEHERVFEAFYQGHHGGRNKSDGLGLGLSIVRRTAEVLGHRVYVNSRVGVGSMFAVLVPMAET